MWPTMQGPRPCTQPLKSATPTLTLSTRTYFFSIQLTHSGIMLHHLKHTLTPASSPSPQPRNLTPLVCQSQFPGAPKEPCPHVQGECAPANSHQLRARAVCSSGYKPAPTRITPPVHVITWPSLESVSQLAAIYPS